MTEDRLDGDFNLEKRGATIWTYQESTEELPDITGLGARRDRLQGITGGQE